MLTIKYLSHSAFLLNDGENQVIIDPFITGNPNSTFKVEDITAKYIIVTHGHGDHIGDALQLAKQNDGIIIAVNELANYAATQGVKVHNMHIGGAYNFPFGRVKFTIAHHGSANHEGQYMGEPAGVLVSIGGNTVYHTGDTGLFYDMKLIGEMNSIDLMMAPIGDNFTMGIDDAVKAAELANPGLIVPMHYNTFPVIAADPFEFKHKIEAIGKKAKVMEFGEEIILN